MISPVFLMMTVLLASGLMLLVYFDKNTGRQKILNFLFAEKPYSIWFYMSVVLISSILRTLIEWYSARPATFVYATPDMGSGYLNSFTWVLFLVVINPLLVDYFIRRDQQMFRKMFHSFVLIMAAVVVLVGVGNVLLSYNYLRCPVFYNFKYFIFPIYMPAGCLLGFVAMAWIGALYLVKKYCPEETKLFIVSIVLFCVAINFFYGYQICLWLPHVFFHVFYNDPVVNQVFGGHQDIYRPIKIYHVTFNAFWFLLPVVGLFPAFIRRYASTEHERKTLKIIFAWLVVLLLLIFYLSMSMLDANVKNMLATHGLR